MAKQIPNEAITSLSQTMFLSQQQCEVLRGLGLQLWDISKYKEPSNWTLARMLQWNAPCGILGVWPQPIRFNQQNIYAVSEGEISEWGETLEGGLTRLENGYMYELCDLSKEPDVEDICFYLGEPDWSEWAPLKKHLGKLYLLVGAGLGVLIS